MFVYACIADSDTQLAPQMKCVYLSTLEQESRLHADKVFSITHLQETTSSAARNISQEVKTDQAAYSSFTSEQQKTIAALFRNTSAPDNLGDTVTVDLASLFSLAMRVLHACVQAPAGDNSGTSASLQRVTTICLSLLRHVCEIDSAAAEKAVIAGENGDSDTLREVLANLMGADCSTSCLESSAVSAIQECLIADVIAKVLHNTEVRQLLLRKCMDLVVGDPDVAAGKDQRNVVSSTMFLKFFALLLLRSPPASPPSPPAPKPGLTDDLKEMVAAGVLTMEQALDMMPTKV